MSADYIAVIAQQREIYWLTQENIKFNKSVDGGKRSYVVWKKRNAVLTEIAKSQLDFYLC